MSVPNRAFTAETQRTQRSRREALNSLRLLCALCVSAVSFAAQPSALTSAANRSRDASNAWATFVDVAGRAGLTAPIIYGGAERKKYMIETNGCGVALFDYDNDGWIDIVLLDGARLEGFPPGKEPTTKL